MFRRKSGKKQAATLLKKKWRPDGPHVAPENSKINWIEKQGVKKRAPVLDTLFVK